MGMSVSHQNQISHYKKETMKYKHAEAEGWYCTIDDNGNKSQSWNKKNKPGYYEEMMAWAAAGNVIEPQFTDEEQAAKDEKEASEALVAYQGLRASEYPTFGDQLDYIYHNGLAAWKTNIITPIKEKYPKPTN